jgi:hypothetical protein
MAACSFPPFNANLLLGIRNTTRCSGNIFKGLFARACFKNASRSFKESPGLKPEMGGKGHFRGL